MSIAAPAAPAYGTRADDGPDPLRAPEHASQPQRHRRAGILLLLTLLIPGGAQAVAGNRSLGRVALRVTLSVWGVLLVLGVLGLLARGFLFSILTHPFVQLLAVGALFALAIGWALLWLDTFRLIQLRLLTPTAQKVTAVATVLALILTSGGLSVAGWALNASRSTLGTIFGSGPALEEHEGRYNVLIMGGDAGEGRTGLRPDSIHVASVDARTGSTVLFSIPRNFQNAPFEDGSPLWDVYPEGYNCGDACIINALYMDVMNQHQDLFPGARDPGAEAMMDAAGGILGLNMSGYVLVDMGGFEQLIDAMGGITITTGGWVTHRGQRPDGQWGNIWWQPGTYTFDGADALAYARSRKFSTDYSRIRRQQCMQQAMLQQFTPATVLTRFQGILDAGEQIVETNVPQSQLGQFVDLAEKSRSQQMRRLTIGAPDFGDASERFTTYPDFDQIHERVDGLLAEDPQASAAGYSPLPVLTMVLASPAQAPGVDEDDPSTWPAAPQMYQGETITPELLMRLEDRGDLSGLALISGTNELCSPGG
ncbi:MAG: LCP family protein [Micrococcus sp.]|nr:LCP family protein [Micrococcus sp.]